MTQDPPPDQDERPPASANADPSMPDTLKMAMRRARYEDAERSGARAELRAARLGRLELLQDALQPLLAQIPPDTDMFDVALVPSSTPRLFIDMIGFVEMGRDAHLYVLQQDTRHGRIRVAESASLEAMIDAVTDYVARRLLERDKALASDAKARAGLPGPPAPANASRLAPRRSRTFGRGFVAAFAFLIDLLGAIALVTLVGIAAWFLWNRFHLHLPS